MSRYHVDTPARLALVQVALDQQHGLRDAMGLPTPREQMVHKPGIGLVPASAVGAVNCYDQPGQHWPVIEGDDGTAAIELPELASVDDQLGKTIRGVAMPRANQLVAEEALPARVRAEVQRRKGPPAELPLGDIIRGGGR